MPGDLANIFEPHVLVETCMVFHRMGCIFDFLHLESQCISVSWTFVERVEIFD